jgi:hypothetical protein
MRLSLPVVAVLAALLPVAVIGCSSGSDAGSDGSGASSTNAAAAPNATTNQFANLPTGTTLRGVLAPKSFFPAGFAQDASTTADSRDAYRTQTTTAPAKPDCTLLSGTGWFTVTRVNEVSFAQTAYVNKTTNAEQDEEVFAYSGTGAATQLADVGKLATLCPSYTDAQTHTKVKVTEHATTRLGDGGYTLTLTDPGWQTGSTLEAVRVGNEIAFVYSTSEPGNGAVDATKLTNYLVTKLKALR